MPPFIADPACLVAPSPCGPVSIWAARPRSRSRTTVVHGPRGHVTRQGITGLTSFVPSPLTGASTPTTPPAASGQGSTGPTARSGVGQPSSGSGGLPVRTFFTVIKGAWSAPQAVRAVSPHEETRPEPGPHWRRAPGGAGASRPHESAVTGLAAPP